ncbi:Hypothetical predicted protein [Cloeon dipterum]|uniref:BTB domain-containing protein n=1 Tax=Cloeon dipterum TaxID=197152 RepID=A0A8S1DUV9_9INSE|nr:Hypothetical predicted protein [Cloeon dipterum]
MYKFVFTKQNNQRLSCPYYSQRLLTTEIHLKAAAFKNHVYCPTALTDVTLAADGQQIEAHKLVLSACSTYFQALFTSYSGHQHPIVILKDVTFRDLRTMVDFMYSGEVHVTQEQLPSIIKTAEMLKVKGLAEGQDMSHVDKSQLSTESSRLSCEALGASTESHQTWSSERRSPSPSISPSAASRRKRMRKSSTGSTSGSGVAERVSDHQSEVAYPHHSPRLEQQGSAQMNLSTDMSERSIREQASTDSEIQNCSQDSGNEQMPLSMVHPGVQQQQQQHPSRAVEEVPSPLMEPSAAHHYSPLSASAGFQWDPSHSSVYYPRYPHPSCSFINTGPPTISPDALRHNVVPAFQPKRQSPCSINIPSVSQASPAPSTPSPSAPPAATPPTSPSPTVRRKRTDTQRDENFLQALEAVRTGGIGFCKAARMYGVNNRTLWLEYRRRGYPITRPSLKPRATTPQEYQYPTVVMKKEPGDSSCSNDDSTLGKGSLSPKQKRGRLLIRQPRLKKETDPLSFESDPEDLDSPQPSTSQHYLQVPHLKVERQTSEPLPAKSSLLQVPTPAYLPKQHSQPLLPSQQSKPLTPKSSILLRQATITLSSEAGTSGRPYKEQVPVLTVTAEPAPRSLVRREPIKRAISTPVPSTSDQERLGHCPLLRPGPALGCNFCWNTIDQHNRILRRKTKYYCPECQTNLCIVPCFQEYHQKFDRQTASTIRSSSTLASALLGASASSPGTVEDYATTASP